MSIVPSTTVALEAAAEKLRQGLLVAFPTETVYGLGANALDDGAARRIFAVKGRPPTDPLICHVASLDQVAPLWDNSTEEARQIVKLGLALGAALWPGPVTLVAKASERVAPCVTGGSGMVGVRIPDHPVALQFLKAAGVPVAAPSANTFGHVSPTTAQHVMDDLAPRDATLTVIDGGSCSIGIESTVVRLHSPDYIEVLRRGKVGVTDLLRAVRRVSDGAYADTTVVLRDTRSKFKHGDVSEPMDGPGQLLTHYSPTVPSFLVTPSSVAGSSASTPSTSSEPATVPRFFVHGPHTVWSAEDTIIIDFKSILKTALFPPGADDAKIKSSVRAYCTLSASGSLDEACAAVFQALRWVETVPGGKVVLFPLLSEWIEPSSASNSTDELLAAVEDRLFRAASGVIATLWNARERDSALEHTNHPSGDSSGSSSQH